MKKLLDGEHAGWSVFCLQPSRPILCTTVNEDGTDHVAPFGWCIPVSQTPPMLALAIQHSPKKSKSLQNIERTGEFVINLPDLSLADQLVLASYDARRGENKFERSGFTRLPSIKVAPCCISQCRAHMECKVNGILYPGDHALITADILCTRYDEEAFRENMLIDVRSFQPVIHLQNFNLKEGTGQLHLFLNAGNVVVSQVPFPK